MKKYLKLSLLITGFVAGLMFIYPAFTRALTIADQNGIPSACPDKAPNNTGYCTVFINSITVNGFVDNDTSYTARTTPVPYGYLIPGQTITISWTDNTDGWNDPFGRSINNYLVKYGCGNSIDLSNDSYTIGTTVGRKYISWTVPSSVSNYQYCKIWVYAEGIEQNYQPTLGVSNTRAFTTQQPVTRYTCNSNYQCVVSSNGEYTSLSSCQSNCVAPTCIINNFSSNKTNINYNENITLSWTTSNCNSCNAVSNPSNSYWNGSKTTSGTNTIYNLTENTGFTLICTNNTSSDSKNLIVNVSSLTRYTCNSNYQCVVSSNGEYSSLTSCQNNCIPPVRYACNPTTYQCYQSTSGNYSTYNDCINACQPPLTRYTCNSNYQCVVDNNGSYTSLTSCQNNCIAPVRYACNASTYQCYQSTSGSYATYNDCLNACQPPLTRYTCNSNYQCVVSSSGEYTSLSSCQSNCVAPSRCVITNFESNNYNISYSDNITLNWSTSNCNSCTASSNPSNSYWYGNQTIYGSRTIYDLENSSTFTLTCSNNTTSDTRNLTVYVSTNSPTLSFWADDYSLTQGESTYLRWTSNNANYCVASNGWSGTKSTANYESTSPSSQTTYSLTCYGNGGQVTQTLTIYVTSPATSLSFTKLGRNLTNGDRVYGKVIRVAQGDVIEFYLTITAGSSNDLSNVVITDTLPSVFSYMPGTTKINGVTQADTITTTGLSLGTVYRGTSKIITFQALSNNPGTYLTYTNIAQASASNISSVSDSATITYGLVAGAATVETGAEDSLLISLILSIGLAGLLWYYFKFNTQGKLALARIENKVREYRLNSFRHQIKK